jgi:hypothetical protein
MVEIAKETILWSDRHPSLDFKLARLARNFRSAAMSKSNVHLVMAGAFPLSTASQFSNYTKSKYIEWMCDARDVLVSLNVSERSIIGYVPLQEAPITEFFFVASVIDHWPVNPYSHLLVISRDELREREQKQATGESDDDKPVTFVVDPFTKAEDSPTGDTARTLKAQLEINIIDATGAPINAPGEFKVTLELKANKLKEVGLEWSLVEKKIVDRALRGRISNVKFNFTVAGKLDMTDVAAKKLFGDWSAEAKASVEADLQMKGSSNKLHVSVGVKMDNEKRTAFPVFELSF